MPSRRPPERPVVGPAAPDVAPSRPVPGSCQRALVRRSPLILAAVVLTLFVASMIRDDVVEFIHGPGCPV